MKKLNIAVYTDSFIPGRGGTEVATYNLCKSFLQLGHNVLLFCPDYHVEEMFDEFDIVRVKSLKLTQSDFMVFKNMQYKKVLQKTKDFNPDIIYYCTASGMAAIAVKIAKKLNKPCVATIHTKFKEAFYNGIHSHLITKILINSLVGKLKKADKVVTVSKDMANELFKYGYKQECAVIKNGVDHLKSFKNEGEIQKKEDIFLFCGSLLKVKNIQFVLKCLATLKNQLTDRPFKLIIIGEGNYKKTLVKLVNKLNLNKEVSFVGYVSDKKQLADYYKKSKLFLFPSTFDTDGIVVCEASQMGTPALTLKGYGASERITDGVNGFVCNYSLEDYVAKLKQIVLDDELYKKVQKNTSTIFGESWLEVAKKYQEIFENLTMFKKQ